jgi:hypothetical protein
MGRRAKSSGISLTADDAAIVKGMLLRGDRQHDIASWFGVNAGRIAEICRGSNYALIGPAPTEVLPPPGPYPAGRVAVAALIALESAKAAMGQAEALVRKMPH